MDAVGALLDPLTRLEAARATLHASLRHASFHLSTTQRLEEQRGRLLGFAAVPTAAGTLRPVLHVERVVEEAGGGDGESSEEYWRLVQGSRGAPSAAGQGGGEQQGSEVGKDLLPYLSTMPSEELRECRRMFQEVLQHAVAVVNAQEEALHAAALWGSVSSRGDTEPSPQDKMGKPGGFFKKLKAKQKREASRRRRGTKGASKEDRRAKQDERATLYAAKREAEELAAVSSSSDSEPSTDSDAEVHQRDRKLLRLRRVLGIPGHGAGHRPMKRDTPREGGAPASSKRPRTVEGRGEDSDTTSVVDSSASDADTDGAGDVRGRRGVAAVDGVEEDSQADAEDWETFLGGAGAHSEDEGSGSDDEEDEDEDRLSEGDLLIDNISDDDAPAGSEDAEGGEVNPFLELLEEDSSAEEEEDLLDPAEFEEEEEEEEEEVTDGESAEDAYAEDDDDDEDDDSDSDSRDPAAPLRPAASTDRAEAESRALLPQFQLGTTSLATLQSSGVLTSPTDPWYLKYHVDTRTEVDRTPLQTVDIAAAAVEALRGSNAARVARARRREAAEGAAVARRDVHFVTSEDYAGVCPENVTVAATAAAREYLQRHPPFSAATTSSPTAAERPPYMHAALWERWVRYRMGQGGPAAGLPYYQNTAGVVLTAEERGLFDVLQSYADVMDCTRCWQNSESRREVFVLHVLNHWFKARAVVVAHDKMLAAHKERRRRRRQQQQQQQQQQKKKAAAGEGKGKAKASVEAEKNGGKDRRVTFADEEAEDALSEDDLELRDRGFGKTRLLVMLPMRHQAYEYVNTIVRLLGADPADCPKLALFEQDFTEVAEAADKTFTRRPRDYQRQFAGNIDDSFCVGLRLEPHRVHVYAHPLNSDLILCSPLGLRRRLEKNGDVLVSLSAIEVCVMDEAHVLLEQNWQQVMAVMELLNKRPTDTTYGLSDLRRVYAWALEGRSGRHRQTIISSDVSHAMILSTFRSAVNTFGKVVLQRRTEEGVLSKVLAPVRQHFLRFQPDSLESVDDDRFEFFTSNVYPTKINPVVERDVRTIIVVPSYFDFVRLRNYMHREYRETFTAISEYTSVKQQRRALGQFSDLERPLLLITERFYFFKRYFVKHAEVLVFYSPPIFSHFYTALVNKLVATSPNAFVMTVFNPYDSHELNRLVGTSRMRDLLERPSGIFSFVTS